MSVFGASTEAPTVIKADKALITLEGAEILALNVTVTFQRAVQVLPVLSQKRVVSVSEPHGTITIEQLAVNGDPKFLEGNGCNPETLTITFMDSCKDKPTGVTCYGCIASQAGYSLQGGRGYAAANVGISFTGMEYK